MSELREKLRPLIGKRITVRGCLSAFGDWKRNYREVGRACIAEPEMDGEVLAHHVWVLEIPHWPMRKDDIGQQVQFSALVRSYTDKGQRTNYCLANPDKLEFLHLPCMTIPDPPSEDEMPADEPEGNEDMPPGLTPDPLQAVREVKTFARACGGLDSALRMVEALQTVTLPLREMVEWIKLLQEE